MSITFSGNGSGGGIRMSGGGGGGNVINGVTVSGTPTSGQVLTATSSTAASWATPSGGGFSLGLLSARPAAGTAGRVYLATDSPGCKFVDDGTAWRPLIDHDCVLGYEPPVASLWTACSGNAGSATITNISGTTAGGGLLLSSPANQPAGWYVTKTGAKTIEVFARINAGWSSTPGNIAACVIIFFAQSDEKQVRLASYSSNVFDTNLQNFTNITTWAANVSTGTELNHGEVWLRLVDDGTDILAYAKPRATSPWSLVGQEARGSFLTTTPGGNRAGIGVASIPESCIEILSFQMY